jgi:hypothetical protein
MKRLYYEIPSEELEKMSKIIEIYISGVKYSPKPSEEKAGGLLKSLKKLTSAQFPSLNEEEKRKMRRMMEKIRKLLIGKMSRTESMEELLMALYELWFTLVSLNAEQRVFQNFMENFIQEKGSELTIASNDHFELFLL